MTSPESVLFRRGDRRSDETLTAPDFFTDLNLDQIVAAITAGKAEYGLTPFFYAALHDVDAIAFRHEVIRDLEDPNLFEGVKSFARGMRVVRDHLGELDKRYHQHQRGRWFLDAVNAYGEAIRGLNRELSARRLGSRGLVAFRDYLTRYASSDGFASLLEEERRFDAALSAIRYGVLTHDLSVEIRHFAGDADYSREVAATFDRFRQAEVDDHDVAFTGPLEMNQVERRILDCVVQLNPETFSKLGDYCSANKEFLDPTVVAFDREIQFYVAYLEYISPLKAAGLDFCYPSVSATQKDGFARQGFDFALAGKLVKDGATPVRNDFHLKDPERIIVVSGPNQGGKTTFARMFAQLHYLASLGLPVPGTAAQLYLPDRIFAHFERQERMTSLQGKLEDDIVRIHSILEAATPRSIIVINEIFSSTALRDAVFLSERIAAAISELDLLCVWVTFVEEVASLSEKTVSMVSEVVPNNPAERTFKIARRPADGLAYAMSIAEKHRLTYARIRERIRT